MIRRSTLAALTGGISLVLASALAAQDPMQDQMTALVEAVAPDEVAVRNTSQILDDATIHYENWGPGPDGEMFKMMEIHSTKQ